MFQKATKSETRLRLALHGPSGGGKTYTALRVAHLLADGGPVAVIDTERGSASKYVGEAPDGTPWAFDVLNLAPPYHPDRFVEAIKAAAAAGYRVVVVDSLTHAWNGQGGMQTLVDEEVRRSRAGNSFQAWGKVRPIERALYDAITGAPLHVICTMRSKTEYVIEENERGKKVPRKLGLAPEQRADIEYEFDVACEVTHEHDVIVSKTRCSALADAVLRKPGPALADPLRAWLTDGAPAPAAPPQPEPQREPEPTPAAPGVDYSGKLRFLRSTGLIAMIETRAPSLGVPDGWADEEWAEVDEVVHGAAKASGVNLSHAPGDEEKRRLLAAAEAIFDARDEAEAKALERGAIVDEAAASGVL